MINIPQKDGEDRKTYLVRLAIAYIYGGLSRGELQETIFYDEAECDGYCLLDDLETEFGFNESH